MIITSLEANSSQLQVRELWVEMAMIVIITGNKCYHFAVWDFNYTHSLTSFQMLRSQE